VSQVKCRARLCALALVKELTNVIQRVSYDKWPDSRRNFGL